MKNAVASLKPIFKDKIDVISDISIMHLSTALELQGRTCQRESGCVGHAAGSEGWLGHFLTWFVPGVGEFFHFTWGLERKQGPCIWGIITFFFSTPRLIPHTSPGWGFQLTGA